MLILLRTFYSRRRKDDGHALMMNDVRRLRVLFEHFDELDAWPRWMDQVPVTSDAGSIFAKFYNDPSVLSSTTFSLLMSRLLNRLRRVMAVFRYRRLVDMLRATNTLKAVLAPNPLNVVIDDYTRL